MGRYKDLSGQKFGRLTVIERLPNPKRREALWRCKCDCGQESNVISHYLLTEHTKSCGCLSRESAGARTKTHGMSHTRLFGIWWAMLNRCENPKLRHYKNYGGRGIRVCKEWHDSSTFFNWALANGYSDHLTLDRENNDGNYTPENCRWVTRTVQANNTSRNHFVNVGGERLTAKQAAEKYGVPYTRFIALLNSGWPPEAAIEYQQEYLQKKRGAL